MLHHHHLLLVHHVYQEVLRLQGVHVVPLSLLALAVHLFHDHQVLLPLLGPLQLLVYQVLPSILVAQLVPVVQPRQAYLDHPEHL